jgi:hypothetical protein
MNPQAGFGLQPPVVSARTVIESTTHRRHSKRVTLLFDPSIFHCNSLAKAPLEPETARGGRVLEFCVPFQIAADAFRDA